MTTNPTEFRDEFVCNAYLSVGGCGLEQQLESAYRALVIHDARERAGNTSSNAGFVRDDAVLAIVLVTDEEDGSVRDCRYAEQGVACTDGVGVFDINAADWSSPSDLNLRLYMYTPGSQQDPTWNIDRYIDPMRPNRGFTSLKPGRLELVLFSAIAGVPINLPTRAGTADVDWNMLLGARPDGSDGYVGDERRGPDLDAPAQHGPDVQHPRGARVPPRGLDAGRDLRPCCAVLRVALAPRRAGRPPLRRALQQRLHQLDLPQRLRRAPPRAAARRAPSTLRRCVRPTSGQSGR